MKCSDTCVVIRSAGERTEELCRYLAAQQVPEENVVVIREHPFSRAVLKSFEVGLDFGLPGRVQDYRPDALRGFKGAKDEIPLLRRMFRWRGIGWRLRRWLRSWEWAERNLGHMILFVCRKAQ